VVGKLPPKCFFYLNWEIKSDKMRKSTVIESINKLPDEFSIDEIIERLIIIEKIEKGRQEVKEGKVNTEEQAKAKLSRWLN
jgi:predicted transcriptional regulator